MKVKCFAGKQAGMNKRQFRCNSAPKDAISFSVQVVKSRIRNLHEEKVEFLRVMSSNLCLY